VVAHLVDEQVAALGGDLGGPVEVAAPATQEDADGARREEVDEERVVVLPAIGASEASITLRRLLVTAQRVAMSRASRLPLWTISTALIGRGRLQW
jgi:hypothetical protein